MNPAIEGYPMDNHGKKADLTMACVGTRKLFEDVGFTKAAAERSFGTAVGVAAGLTVCLEPGKTRSPGSCVQAAPSSACICHGHPFDWLVNRQGLRG